MEERFADLRSQISQMTENVAESRGDQQTILYRLGELEQGYRRQGDLNVALQRQTDAIETLQEKVNMLAEKLRGVADRVAEIEKEPGERWKKIGFEIIKYIVLAAVGAAIGYLSK